MSDDVVTTITHPWLSGVTAETTRTDNKENRQDETIQDDIANDATVATLTGVKKYAGLTATAVEILSGNDEDPAIFAVAFSSNDAVITIADNTNVTVEVIDLVVRVTFGFGFVDYPVRVTVEAA